MRTLDLDAFRAVEEKLQKQLEPIVATQKMAQSIVDAQKPMLEVAARSLTSFAQALEVAQRTLPKKELLDSFVKINDVVNATRIDFDLPEIVPYTPTDFGRLAVEVLEDKNHMIPVYVPDRPLTDRDRDTLAKEVAKELYVLLEQNGLPVPKKKVLIQHVTGAEIQNITIVRPEGGDRFQIIVNEDYSNAIEVGSAKCWQELALIAEEAKFTKKQVKSTFEYFNTNVRCALYTKTNYRKTQILQVQNGFVAPRVDIEVISSKAFATRVNKAT